MVAFKHHVPHHHVVPIDGYQHTIAEPGAGGQVRAETGVDAVKGFSSGKSWEVCFTLFAVCLRGKWVPLKGMHLTTRGGGCRANRQREVSPTWVETEGWRGCIHFSVTMLIL